MNDTSARNPQGATDPRRWLLFIHQLPPKPDYLRVKVRRRLKGIGAVAVKQTVYLLPNTDESLEDFQWLRQEVESAGASALIVEASFIEGISDEELDAMVRAEKDGTVENDDESTEEPASVAPGRTWVTRKGVFVDRIASAWLIRRFIDPEARFRFVEPRGHARKPGELRYDMVGADFTHVGDDCTFQTLRKRFGLRGATLVAIGEIVHDIDCKDELFGRAETAGVAGMLRGIAEATDSDDERIARGSLIFDNLHTFYGTRRA